MALRQRKSEREKGKNCWRRVTESACCYGVADHSCASERTSALALHVVARERVCVLTGEARRREAVGSRVEEGNWTKGREEQQQEQHHSSRPLSLSSNSASLNNNGHLAKREESRAESDDHYHHLQRLCIQNVSQIRMCSRTRDAHTCS